jgi:hypothetical protein
MKESLVLDLLVAASEHAERLATDILLCKTRDEHIRVTARANEAASIVAKLKSFAEEAASE